MRIHPLLLVPFAALQLSLSAAVPPPEQLLPADTLVMATLPDIDKARAAWNSTPAVQFWSAPEMKAFRDKITDKFSLDVLAPMEKELGVGFTNYTALIRGQITFAVTLGGANAEPAGMLLIDTKDKAEAAAKLIADLKQKWVDSGKTVKTQKVRDVEFAIIPVDAKSLGAGLPLPPGGGGEGGGRLAVGQTGSLLMIGNQPEAFEKILVRLSGGSLPALGEQANFQTAYSANFRNSVGYFWVNMKTVLGLAMKELDKQSADAPQDNPMAPPSPAKIFSALGITSLESAGLYMSTASEGELYGGYLAIPESGRKGLLKILAPEAKDASPPAFVPADVTRFFRWRLDGQKTFAGVEALVVEMFPPAQALIGMVIESAGKDKDPNFDLRKMLIGNLGDDLVQFEKAPRSAKLDDVISAPSLMLIGSPRADQLAGAIRTGMGFMIPPGDEGDAKDREFLGRKIYAFPMPGMPGATIAESKVFSFTSSGSYLVMGTDTPMLEEYLRGPESQGRPLREVPGLNEAAQKVGGMGTGMFGYDNQTESLRVIYEAVRKDPAVFDRMLAGPLGISTVAPEMLKSRQAWLDFSLLPPWETVAKYYHYTVFAGSSAADGLHFKMFAPTPPRLRN